MEKRRGEDIIGGSLGEEIAENGRKEESRGGERNDEEIVEDRRGEEQRRPDPG